jgi:hypothetical protein
MNAVHVVDPSVAFKHVVRELRERNGKREARFFFTLNADDTRLYQHQYELNGSVDGLVDTYMNEGCPLMRPPLVCSLVPNRLATTFVIDADAIDGVVSNASNDDVKAVIEQGLVPKLVSFFSNGPQLDWRYVCAGGRFEDKRGGLSLHIFFPFILTPELTVKQRRALGAQLDEELGVLGTHADLTIAGLRFWRCSKPLKPVPPETRVTWRMTPVEPIATNLALERYSRDYWQFTIPVCDDADARGAERPVVIAPRSQVRVIGGAKRKAPELDDAEVGDHPLPDQVLEAARNAHHTPGVRTRKVRYDPESGWFVTLDEPRPQEECPVRGKCETDNHYWTIVLRDGVYSLRITCGHHPESYRSMQLRLGPAPGEELAEFLGDFERTIDVSTPFLACDMEQRKLLPYEFSPLVANRPLAIDVSTFDALQSEELRVRYFNLTISISGGHFLVRDGAGTVREFGAQAALSPLFAPFYTKTDKGRVIPFLQTWLASPLRAEYRTAVYVRFGQPVAADALNLLIFRGVPPPLAPVPDALDLAVRAWIGMFVTLMIFNTRPMQAELEGDYMQTMYSFVIDWLAEVVCGHQKVPFLLALVEARGGVGKTLFKAILSRQLGGHQVKTHKDIQNAIANQFSHYHAMVRLHVFDDASCNNVRGNVFGAFITQTETTTNLKFGDNGVTIPIRDASLMLTNSSDTIPLDNTTLNRRFVIIAPTGDFDQLFDTIQFDDDISRVITALGWRDPAAFYTFGWTRLACEEPTEEKSALAAFLQGAWTPQLNDALRVRVVSQALNSSLLTERRQADRTPMQGYILSCLVESDGTFFHPAQTPAVDGLVVFMPANELKYKVDRNEYWHLPSLQVMFNASVAPGDRIADAMTFNRTFISTFNGLARSFNAVDPAEISLRTQVKPKCTKYMSLQREWQLDNSIRASQKYVVQVPTIDFEQAYEAAHRVAE